MKKILLITMLFYFSGNYAQKRLNTKISIIDSTQLYFEDLKNSSDLYNFRFWNHGQVIDLKIAVDSSKSGTITNFITRFNNRRKIDSITSVTQVYIQKITLTDLQCNQIFQLAKLHKIANLKSENEISNWKSWNELTTEKNYVEMEWFNIEIKINDIYRKKTYGNPFNQHNLPEAESFLAFYSDLQNNLDLKEVFCNFFSKLPLDIYYKNGETFPSYNYRQKTMEGKKQRNNCR